MFGLLLKSVSVALVVLGGHGLYARFYRLEVLFGGEARLSKLFLTIPVPEPFQGVVLRMTEWGFQAMFMPLVTIGE